MSNDHINDTQAFKVWVGLESVGSRLTIPGAFASAASQPRPFLSFSGRDPAAPLSLGLSIDPEFMAPFHGT
jgi:hypothetical protein